MRTLRRGGVAVLLVLITVACGPTSPEPSAPSVPEPSTSSAVPTATSPSPTSPSPTSPSPTSPSSSASQPSKHPGPGPSDPSVPPAENAAGLTITYRADGSTEQVWTLTCAPNGGDHPDPATACAALAKAGAQPFAPVSSDQVCSQQYGGPQTATVTGSGLGRELSGTFSRTNGCEIARWTQLEGLLPAA